MTQRFVIVGGGLAGARAAETLREEGFDGAVTLISVEDEPPYERPVLSKGYLLDTEARSSAYVHEKSWYAERDIELRLGAWATGLDRDRREVVLDGGGRVGYDKLLLATGSWPRRLDVPGADLAGVHYLRDLPEADAIKEAIASGGPLVVVGAGWIGLEIAAAARAHDVAVTILEVADLPLQRVLGDEVAHHFARLHADHGVDLRSGVGATEITGADGRVTGVLDSAGEQHQATAVVVGIGADPQVDWIAGSGLTVEDGVHVSAALQTSDPLVYAAGDIAAVDHPVLGRRVRVEHWAMAHDSGPVAARAMLGHDVAFEALPFFYTDQYDLGMEYVGHVPPGEADQVVLRGDPTSGAFQAFWSVDGVVQAGMHVNQWDEGIDPIKALIGRPVHRDRLADPDVPLSDLAAQTAS